MRKIFWSFLALPFLFACTHHTLSKEQCQAGDWAGIGYSDATMGYSSGARLAKHQAACQEHSIVVNSDKYLVGWNKGIVTFCTQDNGYKQGLDGYVYSSICPEKLEAAFLKGYEKGRELYQVRSKYQQYVNRQNDVRDDLDRARKDLASAKNKAERENATDRINRLEREKDDIERQTRLYEMKYSNSLVD